MVQKPIKQFKVAREVVWSNRMQEK